MAEFQEQKRYYDFFLLEEINEESLDSLKHAVMDSLTEVKRIDESNKKYLHSIINGDLDIKTRIPFNFHIYTEKETLYKSLGFFEFVDSLYNENDLIKVQLYYKDMC